MQSNHPFVRRIQRLARRYRVRGLPTTLMVDGNGQPIHGVVDCLNARDYLEFLDSAEGKALKDLHH